MLVLQMNFANSANFADTRSGMDNIQYFNAFVCNPVNNQVCIEDNVTVHAAFGFKVATFGISGIIVGKRVYGLVDFFQVTFSLKVAKRFNRIIINMRMIDLKFVAYFNRLARKFFFHISNSLFASSQGVNSPSSMR